MNEIAKAVIVISAILLMSGIGDAECGSCTYPATGQSVSWVEGTQVHLQGPPNSGTQARPLNYEWILYKCAGTTSTMANFNLVSGGTTARDLYFYAPPEGSYRIALTVKDQNTAVAGSCYDVKDLCFTTTPGQCPTLCCGEVCVQDTATTSCPWHMEYIPLQGVVPGWEYRWYVKQGATVILTETDTSASTTTPKIQIDVPWNTYAPGDYQVSFEIWAPNPVTPAVLEQQQVCDTSCTCGAGVPTLTPCTVRVVQKPSADISVIP